MKSEAGQPVTSTLWFNVYIIVIGINPDEITARLRIEPTKTRRKGELLPSGNTAKVDSWQLSSPLDTASGDALEPHIEALFVVLANVWSELEEVCHGSDSALHCGVHMASSDTPNLVLEPRTLTSIASLNVTLDLDLYVYPDSELADP
jgi:hypothetical protein